jgi:hypothetical protein
MLVATILLLFLRIANPAHENKPMPIIITDAGSGTATVAATCALVTETSVYVDRTGMASSANLKGFLMYS